MNKIEQALLNAPKEDVMEFFVKHNKEVRKEILQDLYNQAKSTVWEAIEWTTEDIKQYAKKYGVEVDE